MIDQGSEEENKIQRENDNFAASNIRRQSASASGNGGAMILLKNWAIKTPKALRPPDRSVNIIIRFHLLLTGLACIQLNKPLA